MPPVPLPAASAPTINWMLLWVSAHNLCVNPSFEHDTIGAAVAGWSQNYMSGVASSAWAVYGGQSMLLTPKGTGNDTYAGISVAAFPGVTYTVSAVLRVPATMVGPFQGSNQQRNITVDAFINGVGYTGLGMTSPASNTPGVYPQSMTFTVPALGLGGNQVGIRLYNGSITPTDLVYWDQVLISADTSTYFDGDGLGCAWLGTPGNSISVALG